MRKIIHRSETHNLEALADPGFLEAFRKRPRTYHRVRISAAVFLLDPSPRPLASAEPLPITLLTSEPIKRRPEDSLRTPDSA